MPRPGGWVLHGNLGAGEARGSPALLAGGWSPDGSGAIPSTVRNLISARDAELETHARRAEVARALAHVVAITNGVRRVGARLELTYWAESGALTLLRFRMDAGGADQARSVGDRQKLRQDLELALSGYGSSHSGLMRIELQRERAGWVLAYSTLAAEERPPEARLLAVELPKVAERSYRAAHDLSERLLSSMRVPQGGEARQKMEVHLLDGRVLGWEHRLYEAVGGGGPLRVVGPEVVEQLAWLLLGFEEGLGLRTQA